MQNLKQISIKSFFSIFKMPSTIIFSYSSIKNANNLSSLFQYEKYFKQIQNSSSVQQIIRVYDQFTQKSTTEHLRYIALAFRIMTRLYHKNQIIYNSTTQQFISSRLAIVSSTDIELFSSQDIKDFILFFYHYSNHNKMLNVQEKQLISKLLLKSIDQNHSLHQKLLFLRILISSLKLVRLYCPELLSKAIHHIIQLIKGHQQKFVNQILNFINLIQAIDDVYQVTNYEINQLVNKIVDSVISNQKLSFQKLCLANLYTMMHHLKRRLEQNDKNADKISNLIRKIEKYFIANFHMFSARQLNYILIQLIHYHPQSYFLCSFYSLIFKSIDQNGQTPISPALLLKFISILRLQCSTIIKAISPQVEHNIVKLCQFYFHQDNRFRFKANLIIYNIIKRRIFSYKTNVKLLQFVQNSYSYNHSMFNLDKFGNIFYMMQIQLIMLQQQKFQQYLIALNQKIYEFSPHWFKFYKRDNEKEIVNFVKFNDIISLLNISKTSRIKLRAVNKLFSDIIIQRNIFVNDNFGCNQLFHLIMIKIKILSSNFQQEQMIKLIKSVKKNYLIKKQASNKYILALFFHINTLRCKQIISAIIENFFQGNVGELQNIISQKIFSKLNDSNYTFNYYSSSRIIYFYKTYFIEKYWMLIFTNYHFLKWGFHIDRDIMVRQAFNFFKSGEWTIYQKEFINNIIQLYLSQKINVSSSLKLLKELSSLSYNLNSSEKTEMIHLFLNFIIKSHLVHQDISSYLPFFEILQTKLDYVSQQKRQFINRIIQNSSSVILRSKILLSILQQDNKYEINSEDEYYICLNLLSSLKTLPKKSIINNMYLKLMKYIGNSQSSLKQNQFFLQNFIEQQIYHKGIIQMNISFIIQSMDNPKQIIKLLAKYPHQYSFQFIITNIGHFNATIDELYKEIMIILMLSQSNDKTKTLIYKIANKYRQQLPKIFVYAIIQNNKQKLKQMLQIDERKMQIKIKNKILNKIYPNQQIIDFYDIQSNVKKYGVFKEITLKILQQYYPKENIILQHDKPSFFSKIK